MSYSLPATTGGYEPSEGGPYIAPDRIGVLDFIRIARRHMWLMLLTVVIITGAAIVVLRFIPPTYTAVTTVMVQQDYGAGAAGIDEVRIVSNQQLLYAPNLVKAVAIKLNLVKDPEFNPSAPPSFLKRTLRLLVPKKHTMPSTPVSQSVAAELADADTRDEVDTVTSAVLSTLDVQRIEHSRLLTISAKSNRPEMAARLANEIVLTRIAEDVAEQKENDELGNTQLRMQVAELKRSLNAANLAVSQYLKQHALVADTSSPLVSQLRSQEADLTKQLAQLNAFYGPAYPAVVSTSAQLQVVRDRLTQEIARAGLDPSAGRQIRRTDEDGLPDGDGDVTWNYDNSLQSNELRALTDDAANKLQVYTDSFKKLRAAESSPFTPHPSIKIIALAEPPIAPSAPQVKPILAIAFVGSILFAILLAFTVETVGTWIRSAEDVKRLIGRPTLAMIPQSARKWREVNQQTARRPSRSAFARAMRNLYTDVTSIDTKLSNTRVVVITSTHSQHGTTTVAEGLAAVAVEHDVAAVVIKLNHDTRSLTATVEGRPTSIEVEEAPGDNLPVSRRLDGASRIQKLLATLEQRFDLVIFDTPPILDARDAKTLGTFADASLLVIKWGKTSAEAARAASDILGSSLTGVVFNHVDYQQHARRGFGDEVKFFSASSINMFS